MNTELARAYVACPGWQWLPGMLYTYGPHAYRHTEESGTPGAACYPVADDPATEGCILELVRRAWGDPTIHVVAYHTCLGDFRTLWWALARAPAQLTGLDSRGRPASRLITVSAGDDWFFCARPTVPETLLLALQHAPINPTAGE